MEVSLWILLCIITFLRNITTYEHSEGYRPGTGNFIHFIYYKHRKAPVYVFP